MIQYQEIMPLLAQSCASFTPRWRDGSADDFLDAEGNLLTYVALGDFARHLVELASARRFDEFPAVFTVVERLHVEGDKQVQEAATIGLLEAIQNRAEHAGVDKGLFYSWLGSESQKWWNKLNNFWDGTSAFSR